MSTEWISALSLAIGIIASVLTPELRTVFGLDSKDTTKYPIGIVVRRHNACSAQSVRCGLLSGLGTMLLLTLLNMTFIAGKKPVGGCEVTACAPIERVNFTGQIGSYPIAVTFTKFPGKIAGKYYYVRMGGDHALRLEGELMGDQLVLCEYDELDGATGRFSGTLVEPGLYRGVWVGLKGEQLPFTFRLVA